MSPGTFFRSSNPEYVYVSLIYENSNFYASWNPSKPVKIGDYGHLQSDHSFAVEGNIFDTALPGTFNIAPYEPTSTEEFKCIVSRHVDEIKHSGTGEMGASWLHKAKVEQTFTVTRSFGAILVMTNVRYATLEPSGALKDLIYSTAFNKHQVLVSELYTCSSYARLLAPKQTRAVQVTLEASAHQRLLRGTEDAKWTHTADGGDFMNGLSKDRGHAFAPLFRLVGREKTFRRLPIRELSPPKWRRVVDEGGWEQM
ncbi:hypothetical protein FOMPIDRAFT_85658 [Fomitopsis schrenkii]|uniref:Uncharacterized protein n=1 Tax=Fomitopsis schrenkii TaxID=2126942 RepID=S8FEC8_FOMSC|nr:hypothetical protein FOMPIDRAFT_85658 [Fomitopsis schrenkii]